MLVALGLAALVAVVSGVALVAWANRGSGSAGAAPPTRSATTGPTATGPTSGSGGPVVVSLAAELRDSPYAAAVTTLLTQYFTAINTRDYDAWLATLSRRHRTSDRPTFLANYASTVDDDILVVAITTRPDGVLMVAATFRSRQDPLHAPADLPAGCLRWRIGYPLVRENGELRIPVLGKANSSYQRCGSP